MFTTNAKIITEKEYRERTRALLSKLSPSTDIGREEVANLIKMARRLEMKERGLFLLDDYEIPIFNFGEKKKAMLSIAEPPSVFAGCAFALNPNLYWSLERDPITKNVMLVPRPNPENDELIPEP